MVVLYYRMFNRTFTSQISETFFAPTILEFWVKKMGGLTKSKSLWTKTLGGRGGVIPGLENTQIKAAFFFKASFIMGRVFHLGHFSLCQWGIYPTQNCFRIPKKNVAYPLYYCCFYQTILCQNAISYFLYRMYRIN